MKKYIYILITMLLMTGVYAAVTNTDVSNAITRFAGKVGIGVESPREVLDINGSIVLGSNLNETNGTIRYMNGRFEGKTPTGWIVLNELSRLGDGLYLYNDTTTIYFNETKLNATITALDTNGGKAGDGIYLTNDSTTIYFNETKLNATIMTLDTNSGKTTDGTFLYNDSTTIYLNQTYTNTKYVYKDLNGSADLNNKNITNLNSIISYYGSACAAGTFLTDIGDDGTFTCVGTGAVSVGGGWANTSTYTSTSLSVMVGGNVLYVNVTTGRVGIGTSTPTTALDVNGTITATAFTGNGVNLTSVLKTTDEANLNVNSTNYWDSLNTPLDITTLGTITVGNLTVTNNVTVTNDLTVTGEAFLDNVTDRYGNTITANSTCKIITGATATLSIC